MLELSYRVRGQLSLPRCVSDVSTRAVASREGFIRTLAEADELSRTRMSNRWFTHLAYDNTCRLPITHDIKTWCNTCLKYVHKKTRSQPWCTRAGWSRGGTTAVDGLVSCIKCRFARDEEWQCFAKAAG